MKEETKLKNFIQERYPEMTNKNELAFLIEFMLTGEQTKSYQKIYKNDNYHSSAVMATRLLKKVKFSLTDFLDYSGHTEEKLFDTLEVLRLKDPGDYVKYIIKLRQLDVKKVDISGSIDIPLIKIVND